MISELSNKSPEVPISAIVVCYNESRHLTESLKSLSFCDEILVFDMGSIDGSIEIATRLADKVISIPRAPYLEIILSELVTVAKNEWIISQDPDEVFSSELACQIQSELVHCTNIAKFEVPWKFFFRGKPLSGTIWGGKKYKDRVFNKTIVTISPLVHQGITVSNSFITKKIPWEDNNYIHHYWVDKYSTLFEKHWRYIKAEGEKRFSKGKRFSFKHAGKVAFRALLDNLIKYHALKDGLTGLFLSFFYCWYVWMSELSLLAYQLRIERNNVGNNARTTSK